MVSYDAGAILKRMDAGTATEDEMQQLARYNAWRDAERAVVADHQGRINDTIANPANWEHCPCKTCAKDPEYCEVCHPILDKRSNVIRELTDAKPVAWIRAHLPPVCPHCDASLSEAPLYHYNHAHGWQVQGYRVKQWLYVTCLLCGHQFSLWKLGISTREAIT